MCKYKEQAMERAGEMPVLPQTDGAMMADAALTLDALRTIIKAKDGEIATLTPTQQEVVDQMRQGWMLHFNGTIKPACRDDQVKGMRVVPRRVIMALKQKGVIEFTHSSDYWTLAAPVAQPSAQTPPQSLALSAVLEPLQKLLEYCEMSNDACLGTLSASLVEQLSKEAIAALAAPAVAQPERSDAPAWVAVREGWQLAPKDATWEMTRPAASFSLYRVKCDCGQEHQGGLSHNKAAWLYREMLRAAPSLQPTDSAAPSGEMICPQCGVDRFKLPCPGMADECAMIADAHLAASSGDEVVG